VLARCLSRSPALGLRLQQLLSLGLRSASSQLIALGLPLQQLLALVCILERQHLLPSLKLLYEL
jgi:hypothetical protein